MAQGGIQVQGLRTKRTGNTQKPCVWLAGAAELVTQACHVDLVLHLGGPRSFLRFVLHSLQAGAQAVHASEQILAILICSNAGNCCGHCTAQLLPLCYSSGCCSYSRALSSRAGLTATASTKKRNGSHVFMAAKDFTGANSRYAESTTRVAIGHKMAAAHPSFPMQCRKDPVYRMLCILHVEPEMYMGIWNHWQASVRGLWDCCSPP